ncbi:hypothetical protein [Nocardioides sp. WS12]|uniref:hypothetical protein n=1 Tax=Nocardioides sp. WS12 TaxID=2486272 RepID=UPI0015FDA9E5|nr:hypothetical protein [Nocardioides sp. WS12]
MDDIDDLLDRQDGVIARHQVLARGHSPAFVARKVRRRDLVTVHPGVYVNHTGPLVWRQRAWAAVLACWPAALSGWSAIRAHEGPGRRRFDDDRPIEVMVRHGRRPPLLDGVRARESRRFEESAQLHLSPPRQRYDDAIIELADRASNELDMIAVLADACGGRRTTAARLLSRMEQMSRLARRALMEAVLQDVADGTCSVLEHGYLTRVERAHELPRGLRQVAARGEDGRRMFRDVVYGGSRPRWRQIVELDGRLGHDSATDRDRDMERDLDAALGLEDTVRLGYGQVFARSCSTAERVGRLLQMRGWAGEPSQCPECPPADRQGSDQPA